MAFRIATYTTTNGIFNQSQRLQVDYANVSAQAASGLKSSNFEGLSSETQRLLAFESDSNNLTAQSQAIKSSQNRINALKSLTTTISSTLSKASALLSSVQGGLDVAGAAASNVEQAKTLREELASLLNSKLGGDYLFAGSNYDAKPVDLTAVAYNPMAAPNSPDTNYYKGNSTVDTVRAANNLRIDYGVTADNPAFEKAFRALTLFIANPTDPTTLANAFGLMKNSIDGVAGINGTLIAKSNVIENQASLNDASADYYKEVVSGIRSADVAAAAVQTTQIEAQLQASYGALKSLLTLRLSDFLR